MKNLSAIPERRAYKRCKEKQIEQGVDRLRRILYKKHVSGEWVERGEGNKMKATRLDGGQVFHGGCNGCEQPPEVCFNCQYMKGDWKLPNLNSKFLFDDPIEERLKKEGWELDLFSTFLSRKYSYHKIVGKKRYVKVKREV